MFHTLIFVVHLTDHPCTGNDPVGVGLRGLPIGFCIIGGAVISLVLIGVTKGRIRIIMIVFSAMMTAGKNEVLNCPNPVVR